MKFIDKIKKDKQTLFSLKSTKSKLFFIWDYYKIPILIIVFGLVIGIYTTVSIFTKKPTLMKIVLLNSDSQLVEVNDSIFVNELKKANVDVDNKIIDINDYLSLGAKNKEEDDAQTLQVLGALFLYNDLDVFVGYKNDFDRFINSDAFIDLSLVIDKKLLEQNSSNLYIYNDSSGNQIIGGIVLHESSPLHMAYYYHSDVIIGIVNNANNMDNAIAFISQLLKD